MLWMRTAAEAWTGAKGFAVSNLPLRAHAFIRSLMPCVRCRVEISRGLRQCGIWLHPNELNSFLEVPPFPALLFPPLPYPPCICRPLPAPPPHVRAQLQWLDEDGSGSVEIDELQVWGKPAFWVSVAAAPRCWV